MNVMSMHIDKITKIREVMEENGKNSLELLNTILRFLDFKKVEIILYNLLLERSLPISQIKRELNVSERTIREYVKRLLEKGFIARSVETGKRLKYIYSSISPEEAWKKMKDEIEEIVEKISVQFEKQLHL